MPEEVTQSNLIIFFISLILIITILGSKFSNRINLPALLFFIGVGMLTGSEGLGLFPFYDVQVAQFIGMMGLVIILFDGGIKTEWKVVRPVAIPAVSLATVGVLLTSLILGIFAKVIFGLSWPESLLMGAIVGSTDAAAVFAMLQGRNIKKRVGATLEAESGANDPMAMLLTLSFITLILSDSTGIFDMILMFLWQLGGGLVLGLLLGYIGNRALNKIKFSSSGMYPLLSLAFAFLTYSMTSLFNASGLLAVYVAGLVIGNLGIKERNSIFRFNEGISWLAQIGIFFTLGLLVIPSDLFTLNIILQGLLFSMILMFIARPIAVFLSVIGMNFSLKEKTFISWAGLRGAVPIVLAVYPSLAGVEHGQLYFNIIFFVVLTSTFVQGTTISPLANKLGLVGNSNNGSFETLEILSSGRNNLETVEFRIDQSSYWKDKEIKNIPLPSKSMVNIIMRGRENILPTASTRLKEGDILYLLVEEKEKEDLKRLLNK
jgi:cell volume regulation protein A